MDTCSTCKSSYGEPIPPDGRRQCRALAPSMGIEVQRTGSDHPITLASWPYVLPTDWCRQYESIDGPVAPITPPTPQAALEVAVATTPKPKPAPKPKQSPEPSVPSPPK